MLSARGAHGGRTLDDRGSVGAVITGVHAIVYAPDAEEVGRFFRDEIGYAFADAGGGWLIFALPPAELAAHPTDGPPSQELYLMCDDLDETLADLTAKGVELVDPPSEQRGVG